MDISNMLEDCLTVLMTSLSVLTTEGWMMVALQGTAATGGLTDKILGRYLQIVRHWQCLPQTSQRSVLLSVIIWYS